MKSLFQLSFGAVSLFAAVGAQAQFQPLPLTPGSYNFDLVVESNYLYKPSNDSVSATMDNGPATNAQGEYFGGTFMERGADPNSPLSGLPPAGSLLTNLTLPDHVYQLQPSWRSNNALYIGHYSFAHTTNAPGGSPGYETNTFTLTTPTAYTALSFLAAAAYGPCLMTLDVLTTDGQDFRTTLGIPDWWHGSATDPTNEVADVDYGSGVIAYRCEGQANIGGEPSYLGSLTTEILWSVDVPLSDTTSPVNQIRIGFLSDGSPTQGGCAIFAVSGQTTAAGPFNPIAATGYNADVVVESAGPPAAYPFTATLENGTNYMNTTLGPILRTGDTLFEQGYAAAGITNGIPTHGSTITSFSYPAVYLMPASYTTKDAAMIDTNFQTVHLVPETPVSAASLAFLVAGANIQTVMSNLCVVQHLDGVNETNFVIVPDWFNHTINPAWVCNGRVNFGNTRSLDDFNGPAPTSALMNNPRLFDAVVYLSDTNSKITNILVQYYNPADNYGLNERSAILAVSASSNTAPISASIAPFEFADLGSSIPLTIRTAGNPVTYQWYSGTTPIAGATSSTYDIPTNLALGSFNYSVTVGNGTTASNFSTTVTIQYPVFSKPGLWTLNNNGFPPSSTSPFLSNSVLQLTDNHGNEACSAFLNAPVPINGFSASWTYQDVAGGGTGGFAFCLQNSAPTALGGGSGRLGVSGIIPSVEWDFDIDPVAAPPGGNDGGVVYQINGADPAGTFSAEAPVALASGNPIHVTIDYNQTNKTVSETLVDTITGAIFATNFNVGDITQTLGASNAYIGFTAGTGGVAANQVISNFLFQSASPQVFIVTPLTNVNALVGETVTLSIAAAGSPPLTYQWLRQNVPIAGATNFSYAIEDAQAADSGTYSVIVGSLGYTNSAQSSATLSVTAYGILFEFEPDIPAARFSGSTATFNVVAYGGPYSYQWSINGTPVHGATAPLFTTPATLAPGSYNVGVSVKGEYASGGSGFVMTVKALTPFDRSVLGLMPLSYWTLDETTGTVAHDFVGNNSGIYTGDVNLGFPGVTGAGFGSTPYSVLFEGSPAYVDVPGGNLDIANSVTIMAWTEAGSPPPDYQPLVAHADKQWSLGLDTNGFPHFADGNGVGDDDSIGSTDVADGKWHLLTGVYNSTNGLAELYVDGLPSAVRTNSAPPVLTTSDFWIGGTPDSGLPGSLFGSQLADVAVFNKALTSAQIQQLYQSGELGPIAELTTNGFNANLNGDASLTALTNGTPPLTLQWYEINGSLQILPVSGQTNATLTLTNVTSSDNGNQYFLVAANAFGVASNSSVTAHLTVASGAPTFITNISPLTAATSAGGEQTFTVSVAGTEPFAYQWYANGVAVVGATSPNFSMTATLGVTNSVYVEVSNVVGLATSATATIFALPPGVLDFFGNGVGATGTWVLSVADGSGPYITAPSLENGVLQLTDNSGNEGTSAFFSVKQPITNFVASFIYQDVTGGGADGMAFVLQNASATAQLGTGGSLGVKGMSTSVEWQINLYSGNSYGGVGIAWGYNGRLGPDIAPAPIIPASSSETPNPGPWPSDPIVVQISYNQTSGISTETLIDTVTGGSFTTNIPAGNIVTYLGGTAAWVGFTGSDGDVYSNQQITDFSFTPITTDLPVGPTLVISRTGPNTCEISWTPTSSSAFELQQSDFVAGPWTNVTNTPTLGGGVTSVTLSTASSSKFYRLASP